MYPCIGDLFTGVPLDREHTSLYVVPVVARDGGGRAGFAKVRVNVADKGDQRPKFAQQEFTANVYCTAEENSHVVNVSATDVINLIDCFMSHVAIHKAKFNSMLLYM